MKILRCFGARLLIIFFMISGCATAPKFPVYGHFCGPGHPSLPDSVSQEESMSRMKNMDEKKDKEGHIDAIDQGCKKHDICYVQHGYFDRNCDEDLSKDLAEINLPNDDLLKKCANVVMDISRWFESSPSLDRESDPQEFSLKMVGATFGTLNLATLLPTRFLEKLRWHGFEYPGDSEICRNQDFDFENAFWALSRIRNYSERPSHYSQQLEPNFRHAANSFALSLMGKYGRQLVSFRHLGSLDRCEVRKIRNMLSFFENCGDGKSFPWLNPGEAAYNFVNEMRISINADPQRYHRLGVTRCLEKHDKAVNKGLNEVVAAGEMAICIDTHARFGYR